MKVDVHHRPGSCLIPTPPSSPSPTARVRITTTIVQRRLY
jgi:hypothetical protein